MSDERDTVADRIVARIRRREAEGLAEYGERVEDSDVDRMEELLDELVDALFYGEDEIQRRGGETHGETHETHGDRPELPGDVDTLSEHPGVAFLEDLERKLSACRGEVSFKDARIRDLEAGVAEAREVLGSWCGESLVEAARRIDNRRVNAEQSLAGHKALAEKLGRERDELEAEVERVEEMERECRKLVAQVDRMEEAVNWACGCRGGFERPPGEGAYWWRRVLAEKAGMEWHSAEGHYEVSDLPQRDECREKLREARGLLRRVRDQAPAGWGVPLELQVEIRTFLDDAGSDDDD